MAKVKARSEKVSAEAQSRQLAILFRMAGDPTRIQIVRLLADSEKNVTEICALVAQSQPALSHHLALLRHSGIVQARRDGKNNYYSLTDKGSLLGAVIGSCVA